MSANAPSEPATWIDRPANTEHRIQAWLSHPYRMARQLPFALIGQTEDQRRSSIVGFLRQFEDAVRKGPDDLDAIVADFVRVGMGEFGSKERSRARSIYEELRGWALIERHRRISGDHDTPSPDLEIPEHVHALMVELDSIGLTLRGMWREGYGLQQELARQIRENRGNSETHRGETKVVPEVERAQDVSSSDDVQPKLPINKDLLVPAQNNKANGNAVEQLDRDDPLPWAAPTGKGRLVVGWKAILSELKVQYQRNAKDWVKRENDRSRGPIFRSGKTVQVFDDQLKAWWTALSDRATAASKEREARTMQGSDHPVELLSQGMRTRTKRGQKRGKDSVAHREDES